MLNNKKAIFALLVAIYIGYEYYNVRIPGYLEYLEINPVLFRFREIFLKNAFKLMDLAGEFNLVPRHKSFVGFLNTLVGLGKTNITDPNIKIENTKINGINVSIYSLTERKSDQRSILIFYHGGAYCLLSPDNYGQYLTELVKKLDLVVIAVDYRLSPDFAYPTPTDDCNSVTDYVFEHAEEFSGNKNSKIIFAGDSAGGNTVAVQVQKRLKENKKLPDFQILIYPWLNLANFDLLPSHYTFTKRSSVPIEHYFIHWYLGLKNKISESQFVQIISSNDHYGLLDKETQQRLNSYLDVSLISDEHKQGKDYYSIENQVNYPVEIPDDHLFKKNSELGDLVKQMFSEKVSPGLADDSLLKGQPDAYVIVAEYDGIKDSALIYAERLRRADVNVKVAFYENAFHGAASIMKYKVANDMVEDLIVYLKEKQF